jgi:hypothetical protein
MFIINIIFILLHQNSTDIEFYETFDRDSGVQ